MKRVGSHKVIQLIHALIQLIQVLIHAKKRANTAPELIQSVLILY